MQQDGTTGRALVPETLTVGICLILFAMTLISANDMLVKRLSDTYPLHQIVFVRSVIGVCFAAAFLHFEGGIRRLRTRQPGLHALRALLLVGANLFFFTGLASASLAEATAVFFVFPLVIALLQWPMLGQAVGPRRLVSIGLGFAGVLVMLAPWSNLNSGTPAWALALPVAAAVCYALMHLLTRKLGQETPASGLALFNQAAFTVICGAAGLAMGNGRFLSEDANPSLAFLLRPWVWPTPEDWVLFALLGCAIGLVAYAMAQAYRVADPATVAPFEYVVLPLAVLWGLVMFGDVPDARTWLGIALIGGAGIYVYLRERAVGATEVRPHHETPR